MPITVYDNNGAPHKVAPKVYDGYWRNSVAWIYSGGAWRRTYDPSDENLITNSRMLNGSDYFTYSDGTVIGSTPPGWSAYSNTPVGGNSYAIYSNNDAEYSRSYTFKAAQSRMFFQARVYVRQGETYNASAFVGAIDMQVGRKAFDIYADGIPGNKQPEYIQFITSFPTVPELTANMNVNCQFKALKDCIVQFNIGVGVDYNDSGDIQIDSPQITKSLVALPYQPTPLTVNYNAVLLDDSRFDFSRRIQMTQGTHHIESSVVVSPGHSDKIMILSRYDDINTSGIGYDSVANTLFVMADNVVVASTPVIGTMPVDSVFGFGLWFDVSGGYIQNIRLHVNGRLVAKILGQQPVVSAFDSIFGSRHYNLANIRIEQFAMFFNNINYLFNLEEGSGNQSVGVSTASSLSITIRGTENTNFRWVGKLLPVISSQPLSTYVGSIGSTTEISFGATGWDTIQWRTQYGDIVGATSSVLTVSIPADYNYDLVYHAVLSNRFGKVKTSTTTIIPYVGFRMATETGEIIVTEDDNNISME